MNEKVFADDSTDMLVTFAFRRWQELNTAAQPGAEIYPLFLQEQRGWEMIAHLYSALEAKTEKVRWFAQVGAAAFPWLEKWNSRDPLVTEKGSGRADHLLGHRATWVTLRPFLLDVQDIRHSQAHPNPTGVVEVDSWIDPETGWRAIQTRIVETRAKRIDRESHRFHLTQLPMHPYQFTHPEFALSAAVLVAALVETNLEFDRPLITHTNGQALGLSVQPDIWLDELLAIASSNAPTAVVGALSAILNEAKQTGSEETDNSRKTQDSSLLEDP